MQKSLKQIQQENRKFILEAIGESELLKQQALQIYHKISIKTLEKQTEETQTKINELFNN